MTDKNNQNFEGLTLFMAQAHEGPVMMLNLLRFRDKAAYPDGDRGLTGRDAYETYMEKAEPFFEQIGGDVIWRGKPLMGLIGPPGEVWDTGFIVRYPDKKAFVDMVNNPDYRALTVHRNAALLDSRLHAFADTDKGVLD